MAPDFGPPGRNEYSAAQEVYVRAVGEGDPLELLQTQAARLESAFRGMSDDAGGSSYEVGKWTIKQVLGHVTDTERILSYRLLRIARGDVTPLPGYDEKVYAVAFPFDARRLAELLEDFRIVRLSTLRLLQVIPAAAWENRGSANGSPVSARALLYILAGHAEHHLELLRQKYGVPVPPA